MLTSKTLLTQILDENIIGAKQSIHTLLAQKAKVYLEDKKRCIASITYGPCSEANGEGNCGCDEQVEEDCGCKETDVYEGEELSEDASAVLQNIYNLMAADGGEAVKFTASNAQNIAFLIATFLTIPTAFALSADYSKSKILKTLRLMPKIMLRNLFDKLNKYIEKVKDGEKLSASEKDQVKSAVTSTLKSAQEQAGATDEYNHLIESVLEALNETKYATNDLLDAIEKAYKKGGLEGIIAGGKAFGLLEPTTVEEILDDAKDFFGKDLKYASREIKGFLKPKDYAKHEIHLEEADEKKLTDKQKKLDKNHNDVLDKQDFVILRSKKKKKED